MQKGSGRFLPGQNSFFRQNGLLLANVRRAYNNEQNKQYNDESETVVITVGHLPFLPF